MCMLFIQSCPTLCNPMDYSPLGSSVHGILQAGLLEWVALPLPRSLICVYILCVYIYIYIYVHPNLFPLFCLLFLHSTMAFHIMHNCLSPLSPNYYLNSLRAGNFVFFIFISPVSGTMTGPWKTLCKYLWRKQK